MKLITLDATEFDNFSKNHELTSFYQTSMYGNSCINDFKVHYIGILNNNDKLIGASLILYKKIFLDFKYAYAPRGILIDYTNKFLLKEFTIKLKQLLLKQGFIFIKIDPLVIINKKNSKGDIILVNKKQKLIMNNFYDAGYIYKGNNKYFENAKPRFDTYVNLNNSDYTHFTFKKNHKNKIRRSLKYGVEVIEDENQDIDSIYHIIKKKYNKSKLFYKNLINNFKDNIKVYNIYINTKTAVINSKYLYERELEKNEQISNLITKHNNKNLDKLISKKMQSDILLNNYKRILVLSTKLLETNPHGLLIGTSIFILYNNKVYLLIESFDKKYSEFYPTYLLKWRIIQIYSKLKYKEFNLNAITGNFSKDNKYVGLNDMKLGFNGEINEYIGEFDYIINRPIYYLYNFYHKITKQK